MDSSSSKRKHDASSGGADGPKLKKRQGGSGGKWQTPHYKAKLEAMKGRHLEVGDMGIWTTCQRHKEQRAVDELVAICEEYGEKLYGLKPAGESKADNEDGKTGDEEMDIEDVLKRELEELKSAKDGDGKRKEGPFEPIRTNLDCLLFMRTRPPVDPIALVRAICTDAAAGGEEKWKSRFINKFTPITLTGKATEKGVEEVARTVLGKWFRLREEGKEDEEEKEEGENGEKEAYSYAIRPSFRAHNTLKRDDVIKQVAGLIAPRHKVNLSAPDKVILIDIFQTFCGMSVVDGDWDALKKYNLHELYLSSAKGSKEKPKEEVKEVSKEEASKEEPREEETTTS
ncbi:hypothetical protein F5X96DRAFT_597416 [Biscogniauxia mediterranea]|nr:hypothetical protein F5X96DRAFT_597416 [Biscogniauxia mediterranea]